MRFNTENHDLRGQSNRYMKYNGITVYKVPCTVQYVQCTRHKVTHRDGCVRKHCDRYCCCCCESDSPSSSGGDATAITAITAITDTATNILRHRSSRGASEPARGVVHGWVYLLHWEHSSAGGSTMGLQPLGATDQGWQ
jgi:hypothetical protein